MICDLITIYSGVLDIELIGEIRVNQISPKLFPNKQLTHNLDHYFTSIHLLSFPRCSFQTCIPTVQELVALMTNSDTVTHPLSPLPQMPTVEALINIEMSLRR